MPKMKDGTVLPSFLKTHDKSHSTPGSRMTMTDTTLRVGEIIRKYEATDPQNVSKMEVEYVVNVNHRDGCGVQTQTPYRAVLRDGFGSTAPTAGKPGGDHFRHSLRGRTAATAQNAIDDGALVLLACINGDKSQAIILSCLKHPQYKNQDPPGRFLDFEFNGVGVKIDDDGAFTLQILGATKNDGTPDPTRDPNNLGTIVTVEKTGDIFITDSGTESITISPANKTITVEAYNQVGSIGNSWSLTAPSVKVISDDVKIATAEPDLSFHLSSAGVELGGTEAVPASDPVALSTATEARLVALELFAQTHTHPGVMPGPSLAPPSQPTFVAGAGAVAATKVKGV